MATIENSKLLESAFKAADEPIWPNLMIKETSMKYINDRKNRRGALLDAMFVYEFSKIRNKNYCTFYKD